MNRRQNFRRERRLEDFPALTRHPECGAKDRLGRGRTKTDEQLRFHDAQLRFHPWATRRDFARVRFLVNAPFAARLPFEMLHRVRHVDVVAIDLGFLERAIEQLAGWPDERLSGEILLVAWLLAQEQQLRPLRTFAEDGLRSELIEMTSGARLCRGLDFREVVSL